MDTNILLEYFLCCLSISFPVQFHCYSSSLCTPYMTFYVHSWHWVLYTCIFLYTCIDDVHVLHSTIILCQSQLEYVYHWSLARWSGYTIWVYIVTSHPCLYTVLASVPIVIDAQPWPSYVCIIETAGTSNCCLLWYMKWVTHVTVVACTCSPSHSPPPPHPPPLSLFSLSFSLSLFSLSPSPSPSLSQCTICNAMLCVHACVLCAHIHPQSRVCPQECKHRSLHTIPNHIPMNASAHVMIIYDIIQDLLWLLFYYKSEIKCAWSARCS